MVYSTACAISERSNVLCGRTKLVAAMSTLMAGVAPAQAQNDPQVAELPAVVVTATGYEQDVKDAPASISVITREELERQPYRELTDALAEVPGVSISTGEGNTRDISIRGMGPQYTLILVDGKRMSTRESRTSAGTVNNISETGMLPPLEAIERIEVIRGPMSSLYGSDALGGVVNIITRRIGKEWQGSVRVNGTAQLDGGFGSYGESSFYLSGPLIGERLGLQLTGSANRRAEDDIPGGSPERKDESLTAKLGWKVSDNHDLLFEVGRYNQKASNTVGKSAEATATTGSVMEMERTVYSATHFGSYGSGVTSESYIQHETGEEVREQKTIKNITAQSSFLVPLGQNNLLNVGAFYRLQDLTDLTGNRLSGSTSTGTERKNWALFAENEWSVTDSFALTAGLRMDHDELYGQEWLPRLYGV